MTCIVGLEHEGNVYMGCDSAATDEMMRHCVTHEQKIVINGDTMMGFCGNYRIGQILTHSLEIPDRSTKIEDDFQWLVSDYIDAVRGILDEKGQLLKGENSVEMIADDSQYLLSYRSRLYVIEENFGVLRINRGYAAVGCGGDFALGVMHYLSQYDITDPVTFCLNALEAATEHSAGCSSPHLVFKHDVNGDIEQMV